MKVAQLFFIALFFASIPSFAQTPSFKVEVVDNKIDIGYGLAIGDVDGDKKPDILLADKKQIVWYKNPSGRNQPWTRYVMADNLTKNDNVCIAAREINGQLEVAVGAQWNPGDTKNIDQSGAVFYLERPKDVTQLWKPIQLHHEVTIHRMAWAKTTDQNYHLLVLPLHGLNNENGEGVGVNLISYKFPEEVKSANNFQLLATDMHLTHNLQVVEEKQTHVIIAGKEGITRIIHKNGAWEKSNQWLSKSFPAGEVQTGQNKVKGYFTAAVEPMHGNMLTVSTPNNRVVLTDNMAQGHALGTADLLKKGSDQIVVGWRNPNRDKKVGVRMYVQDEQSQEWQEHLLDESVMMACEDLKIADLDGDGKLDIIAAGRATLNVLIYWNNQK